MLAYVAVVATFGTLVQIGLTASLWVLIGGLMLVLLIAWHMRYRGKYQ